MSEPQSPTPSFPADAPGRLTPGQVISTRAGRALLWVAVLAGLVQVLPGLERLRWLPDDPRALLPRFLRFEPDALPWRAVGPEELAAATPVDDRALLEFGQEEGALKAPLAPKAPKPAAPRGPAAPAIRTAGPPIALRGVFTEETPLPPPPPVRDLGNGLNLVPMEDPHRVLDGLVASLARTAGGQGQTHIVHYGDSLITGDYITQTLRRLLQKKFGDAGHGFVLGGLTSPWYRRNNLDLKTSEGWEAKRITRPQLADGRYGLGAVAFKAEAQGEWVEYKPKDQNGKPTGDAPTGDTQPGEPLNQRIGQVEVFAWGGPRSARLEVRVDGELIGVVDTRRPQEEAVFQRFELTDEAHKVRLTTVGGGEVRLFGVALERKAPGVVYDSLGVDGTRVKILRFFDEPHWYAQLRHRAPDLIVLHYGANEGEAADLGTKNYREDLLPVVLGLRKALPDVPCLLVGPMDRADKNEAGELVSRPVVQRITDVQRRVAYMAGCAFFDTFRAMGGEGSMARWYQNHLGGGDMTHPTRQGADRIGAMIFASLMDTYRRGLR